MNFLLNEQKKYVVSFQFSQKKYHFIKNEFSLQKKYMFSLKKKYVVSFNTTKEIFLIIG